MKISNNHKVLLWGVGIICICSLVVIIMPGISDKSDVNNDIDSTVINSTIKTPAYCHDLMPEKYIKRFSYVSDVEIGDTAWVSYITVDSLGNTWLRKDEDIWHEKKYSKVIMVTRDSSGYIVDLRFWKDAQFNISDPIKPRYEEYFSPVYCIITDFE